MNKSIYISILKVVFLGNLLLFLQSCDLGKDPVICEVGEHQLSQSELDELIRFYMNQFDEETRRQKVIDIWVQQRLIEVKAREELPIKQRRNKIKAAEEEMNLNLFDLENKYIQEHLDSTVTDQEIQQYYTKHRENYKTSSYIVKALYLKIPDTLLGESKIEEHFLLKNDKDIDEIKKYGNLYANNFYFGDNKWIFFDDLVKEIPMSEAQKETLIRERGEGTFNIDGFTYFINVLDFRTKSISSPMETEQAIIKVHILKRRVNQLRKEAKETILKNAKETIPIVYH